MHTNPFLGKTANEIIGLILDAETPTQIDSMFSNLNSPELSAIRPEVIDGVEKFDIDFFKAVKKLDDLGQWERVKHQYLANALLAQTVAQSFFNILQVKGDQSNPLVKKIVENVGKLTDEEYSQGLPILEAGLNAIKTLEVPPLPFKRTPFSPVSGPRL